MTSNEQGRFCAECNVNVLDFTQSARLEDIDQREIASGLCGRFYSFQVENENRGWRDVIISKYQKINAKPSRFGHFSKMAAAFVFLVLILAGCASRRCTQVMGRFVKVSDNPNPPQIENQVIRHGKPIVD